LSIIDTIFKKQQEAGIHDIDILVSNQALNSCYTKLHHIEELKKRNNNIATIQETETIVNIPKSPS